MMLVLVAQKGHDTHVPDGEEVVKEGDGHVDKHLVLAIGAQKGESVVQLHGDGGSSCQAATVSTSK